MSKMSKKSNMYGKWYGTHAISEFPEKTELIFAGVLLHHEHSGEDVDVEGFVHAIKCDGKWIAKNSYYENKVISAKAFAFIPEFDGSALC